MEFTQRCDAFLDEVEAGRGADRRLDAALDRLKEAMGPARADETKARLLTETMAVTLQGALLVQYAPAAIADAFCASRLAGDWGYTYGTLGDGVACDEIIARATVETIEGFLKPGAATHNEL